MALESIPGPNAAGRPELLRDVQRGIEFRSRGSVGMGRTSVFELTLPSGSFGVSASGPEVKDERGAEYALWTDLRVGEKEILFTGDNIEAHAFASDEERRVAALSAVECFLVYGLFYNGLTLRAGYCRVLLDGKEYRREDFGYSG